MAENIGFSGESKISHSRKKIDELQAKIALLNGRSLCLQENGLISEELSNRIESRLEKWRKLQRDTKEKTYFSKLQGSNGQPHRSADLEPACERKIRHACEQIIVLKKKQLLQEVNERTSDEDERRLKDQLWTKLEELLEDFKPKEILESLKQNTVQSARILQSRTTQVDLMRDAEELRFKFESGKLKDVSRQPVLLQSVDQLIERFVESEKAKNDIWKEKKRFERAQQILNNALQKQYGTNPKEINLKRRVLDLETELYGIEAAISYTKELINDVTGQRETKRKAEESLLAKFRKIQEFEKTAQRKQMMIQTLVKQNGRARNQLELQQNELLSYVKNQITLLGKEIDSTVDDIKQKYSSELELFSSLQLSQLESVELQNGSRVPFESLSIHQQEGNEDNASRLVKQMKDALKVPKYLAPEELIFKIKELKEKETESNNQRKLQVSHDEEIVYDEFIKKLARMQDQCKTIVDQTESKRRQTLSVLRGSFSNATDALKECLDLGKLTNTWWDQPAQFLVPWIKEDGMDLRQWHTQWEINSARLAETQLFK